MKIVADSMVWVSYFSNESGFRHQLLEQVQRSRARLFVSEYLVDEVRRALIRDFEMPRRDAQLAGEKMLRMSRTVKLPASIPRHVPGDSQDDPIVETAIQAKADYLVTTDEEIRRLKKIRNVMIITPVELARQLGWSMP